MLSNEEIKKYEAAGFKRWTKGNMDRLYIDATKLGLELDYYKTGNISHTKWCGEIISNADGYRFKSSKAYVDVATGELHVKDMTSSDWHFHGLPTLEEKAQEAIAAIRKDTSEEEA